jgi:hypothetical protein
MKAIPNDLTPCKNDIQPFFCFDANGISWSFVGGVVDLRRSQHPSGRRPYNNTTHTLESTALEKEDEEITWTGQETWPSG